ncbi:MAG: sugar phosphate isomerase/epimerase [Lentisphaeria bacterium]|nr:sugar phosphate isomerase/epimerase [Lentisphaeria bacterium]NQZ69269.1 sugar phosphate isomerase/epimerase [Lentisphaeria bacterium]
MEIGICADYTEGSTLNGVVDYIEENVQRLLNAALSDDEFEKSLTNFKDKELPVPVANSFIPGTIKTTGPEMELDEVLAYANTVLKRAKLLEISQIVFGSGGSRQIEEGVSKTEAFSQFITVNREIAVLAEQNNIMILIEPLNSAECNFITTLEEGAEIVERVNHPNVQLLADFYHMLKDDEDAAEILRFGHLIQHIHIAERDTRSAPGVAGDDFMPFFSALKQIDYTGNISFECSFTDKEKELQVATQTICNYMDSTGL